MGEIGNVVVAVIGTGIVTQVLNWILAKRKTDTDTYLAKRRNDTETYDARMQRLLDEKDNILATERANCAEERKRAAEERQELRDELAEMRRMVAKRVKGADTLNDLIANLKAMVVEKELRIVALEEKQK